MAQYSTRLFLIHSSHRSRVNWERKGSESAEGNNTKVPTLGETERMILDEMTSQTIRGARGHEAPEVRVAEEPTKDTQWVETEIDAFISCKKKLFPTSERCE